jgi:TonB family protein
VRLSSTQQARLGTACALTLVLPLIVRGDPAKGFVAPPPIQLQTLAQLDSDLEALRRAAWQMQSYPGFQTQKDVRGRTASQDVDTWYLTAPREEQLTTLRATAQAQSGQADAAALTATLAQAASLIQRERYRAIFISVYWSQQGLFERHLALLGHLETQVPAEQRAAAQAPIDAAATALADGLTQALRVDSDAEQAQAATQLNKQSADLLRLYNESRGKLAATVSREQRVQGTQPAARERESSCPAAVTPTSGTAKPALAMDNQAPATFYPPDDRRNNLEGVVTVLASISATGCAVRTQVFESSGVPGLDAAALNWAEQARYRPAEREHQAVDGTLLFRVRFALND